MTLASPEAGRVAPDSTVEGAAGAALVAGEGAVAGGGALVSAVGMFVAGLVVAGGAEGAATAPVSVLAIWISAPSEGRYDASTKKGERFSRR